MTLSADSIHSTLRDLQERLVSSIVATLPAMLSGHEGEDLYAVAITTDSDVITCSLLAHTEQCLAAIPELEEEPDYYRWFPDEWCLRDWEVDPPTGAESTADVSRGLFDLKRSLTAEGTHLRDWKHAATDMLIGALGDESVRQVLGNVNADWSPVLFVTETDGDSELALDSLEQLNGDHPHTSLLASAREFYGSQA